MASGQNERSLIQEVVFNRSWNLVNCYCEKIWAPTVSISIVCVEIFRVQCMIRPGRGRDHHIQERKFIYLPQDATKVDRLIPGTNIFRLGLLQLPRN